jgi:hypothetical protein
VSVADGLVMVFWWRPPVSCFSLARVFLLLIWSLLVSRCLASQKKLTADEEEAEEALFVLQQQLSTVINRLTRIRRIRKQVEKRGSELFARGIAELDAEDGVTPRPLADQEEFAMEYLQELGVPPGVDWGSFGLGSDVNESSLLGAQAAQGSAGGSGQASVDNASGA